jgi:hypothetical protein
MLNKLLKDIQGLVKMSNPSNFLTELQKREMMVNQCFEPAENRMAYGESYDDPNVPAEPYNYDLEDLND